MAYINFKNPFDKIKTDWIQIDNKNSSIKTKEIKREDDIKGVFTKMGTDGHPISAQSIVEELKLKGIEVSRDTSMTPNGVTCSTAGILIALDKEPSAEEVKLIELAIKEASKRKWVERIAEKEGESKGESNISTDIDSGIV
jgi:methylmalonyl-CoA mutase cobalamin-binding subunit